MNKKLFFSAVIVGVIIIIGYIFYTDFYVPSQVIMVNQSKKTLPVAYDIPKSLSINGLEVGEQTAKLRPVAVMIDNAPEARPQSGLAAADIVYETLTEGPITRFMAIFQTNNPPNIGPIRSARTYFVELADELNAIYTHVGGNSDALLNIQQGAYPHIANADQFFFDSSFHRIKARYAPHNVYTSLAEMRKLSAKKQWEQNVQYGNWKFSASTDDATSTASKITINFSLPSFAAVFSYDNNSHEYLRYMGGVAHTDAETGKQIRTKNIIVQMVEASPVQSDTPLSISLNLAGSGKSYVFRDGRVIEGTWKRDQKGITKHFDTEGREIQLSPGKIWVALLPNNRILSWK